MRGGRPFPVSREPPLAVFFNRSPQCSVRRPAGQGQDLRRHASPGKSPSRLAGDSPRCPDGDLDRRGGWPACTHDPRFIADPDVATDAGAALTYGEARRRPGTSGSQSLAESFEPGVDPLAVHAEVALPVNGATVDGERG